MLEWCDGHIDLVIMRVSLVYRLSCGFTVMSVVCVCCVWLTWVWICLLVYAGFMYCI